MEKQKYMREDIDSLISQIEDLTGPRPLFYLKFCKERKYAEDVVKGLLYANTVEYFRKLEERRLHGLLCVNISQTYPLRLKKVVSSKS